MKAKLSEEYYAKKRGKVWDKLTRIDLGHLRFMDIFHCYFCAFMVAANLHKDHDMIEEFMELVEKWRDRQKT